MLSAILLLVTAIGFEPPRTIEAAPVVLAPVTAVAHRGPGEHGVHLPRKSPKAVGMSAARLAIADRAVTRGISAGGFPGAAVVVGRRGAAVWQKGFGHLDWSDRSPHVSPDASIYDLASLSKVIGTTTAAMILYDEGRLTLDAPVARYLPTFSGGDKGRVTVRMLLTHTSGLPAGRDLWRMPHNPDSARALVLATPLVTAPGATYEYSDLGADVLGFVIEAIAGEPLDRFLAERVFAPLGMAHTMYRPSPRLVDSIAPTEVNPPRGYPLRGEVHDENAFALGGVAGHAGLFSTASDLAVFAQMMLNGGTYNGVRIVSDTTVARFTARASGHRALGWDTCIQEGSCGSYLSDRAYGHTGFTGTSIWIDPEREMFVILLTNRVHAPRAHRPAKVIADVRADLADAAALAVLDGPDGVLELPDSFRADRRDGWFKPTPKMHHRRAGRSSHRRAHAAARSASARHTAKPDQAKPDQTKPRRAKLHPATPRVTTHPATHRVAAKPTRGASRGAAAHATHPNAHATHPNAHTTAHATAHTTAHTTVLQARRSATHSRHTSHPRR